MTVRVEPQCCGGFVGVWRGRRLVGGCMWLPEGWYFQRPREEPVRVYFKTLDECLSAVLSYLL